MYRAVIALFAAVFGILALTGSVPERHVKIGAECMRVKGKVQRLDEKFSTANKHLTEMQDLMKANGLEIDNRTIIDKLKAFDKSTIVSEGAGLVSGIKTVYSLVSEIAKLAA